MKNLLSLLLLTLSLALHAATDRGYFTVVIFSDPHVTQSSGATVDEMKGYVKNIVNMGKVGGAKFAFSKAPAGFVPRADLVFCLGDMDPDSEKTGNSFKESVQGFNDANIPFLTICGNHDLVPDYWNGGDTGLTWGINDGGAYCNDVALNIVTNQYQTAIKNGITDATRITHDSNCIETSPMVFSFNGVRFYFAQTYWFQKPYAKPTLFKAATYYAPDGIISDLETYVANHKEEPSVWLQHYPFVAGSDNDRWWSDENSSGQVCKPSNATAYDTPKKKKDKLVSIIAQTKNPWHFSGHYHYYATNTYTSTTNKTLKVKDYTVAAPFLADTKGAAYLVLMKEGTGVVQVQQVSFAEDKIKEKVEPLEENVYYNILNLDAGLYLTLQPGRTEDGATLQKLNNTDGQYFRLISTQGSGTTSYNIKTPTRYYLGSRVYYSRSDELNPTTDNSFAFTEDGGGNRYTIAATSNATGSNLLGLDNLIEGSPIYTNKTSANHATWILIPTTKPVFNEVLQETPKTSSGANVQCYYIRSLNDAKYCSCNQGSTSLTGCIKTADLDDTHDGFLFYLTTAGNGKYLIYNYLTGCAAGKLENYIHVTENTTPQVYTLTINESKTAYAIVSDPNTSTSWNYTFGYITLGSKEAYFQFIPAGIKPRPTVGIEPPSPINYKPSTLTHSFDLSGRKTTNPQKGLYIFNGKKCYTP